MGVRDPRGKERDNPRQRQHLGHEVGQVRPHDDKAHLVHFRARKGQPRRGLPRARGRRARGATVAARVDGVGGELKPLEHKRAAQGDADAGGGGAEEDVREAERDFKREEPRRRRDVKLGQRPEQHDRRRIVQHALPKHEVEEQRRRRADRAKHGERGDGVRRGEERPVQHALDQRLRAQVLAAHDADEVEGVGGEAEDEGGEGGAENGKRGDRAQVAEEAFRLERKPAGKHDGWEQAIEKGRRGETEGREAGDAEHEPRHDAKQHGRRRGRQRGHAVALHEKGGDDGADEEEPDDEELELQGRRGGEGRGWARGAFGRLRARVLRHPLQYSHTRPHRHIGRHGGRRRGGGGVGADRRRAMGGANGRRGRVGGGGRGGARP